MTRPEYRKDLARAARTAARRKPRTPSDLPPAYEAARRELALANCLLQRGDVLVAARQFARVALLAARHGMPRRAAVLAARAARASLQAGAPDHARSQTSRAVRLAIQGRDPGYAARLLGRALAMLAEGGHYQQVEALKAEFGSQLGHLGLVAEDDEPLLPLRLPRLPGQCPACLGPVDPHEVAWVDPLGLHCAYCGAQVYGS